MVSNYWLSLKLSISGGNTVAVICNKYYDLLASMIYSFPSVIREDPKIIADGHSVAQNSPFFSVPGKHSNRCDRSQLMLSKSR